MDGLAQLRDSIDEIDQQLVELLNRRAQVSVDIGKTKSKNKNQSNNGEESSSLTHHIYAPTREKEVFNKLTTINQGPLKPEALHSIWREIISSSRSLQQPIKVAYLGPPGSFSHQAAMRQFGDAADYVAFPTIGDVFENVSKTTSYGIAPIENSIHGSVVETLDNLRECRVSIRAETYMIVHQNLLSTTREKSKIKRIYSHPQGFGQTTKWLQVHLPGVERITVSSTSEAAKRASEEAYTGAIAPIMCSDIYGLEIVAESIEDYKDNTTRFFVLASEFDSRPKTKAKTLIRFTVDHRQPGALCDSLRCFKTHNINLTKIESRPSLKRIWQYVFFLEFEGYVSDDNVQKALAEIKAYTLEVTVLGTYPDQLEV